MYEFVKLVKLQDTDNFTFNDGTAHAYKSDWFKDLHKYSDTVTEDTWSSSFTKSASCSLATTLKALNNRKGSNIPLGLFIKLS